MRIDMAREPRERRNGRARQRVRRQARPHQPRRQSGEGRPALRLCGAGRRRRSEGPGRLRPRQGARGAGGDPQGDRGRQARAYARAAARGAHAASRRGRPPRRRQGLSARRAAGHRHHRRRPDARGVRDARHAGRGGEVARHVEPLQRGARHVRCAQAPGFCRARLLRGATSRSRRCRRAAATSTPNRRPIERSGAGDEYRQELGQDRQSRGRPAAHRAVTTASARRWSASSSTRSAASRSLSIRRRREA